MTLNIIFQLVWTMSKTFKHIGGPQMKKAVASRKSYTPEYYTFLVVNDLDNM